MSPWPAQTAFDQGRRGTTEALSKVPTEVSQQHETNPWGRASGMAAGSTSKSSDASAEVENGCNDGVYICKNDGKNDGFNKDWITMVVDNIGSLYFMITFIVVGQGPICDLCCNKPSAFDS